MAITTASELAEAESQLTLCREAIRSAMKRQSFSIGDQSVANQRLLDLRDMERELVARVSRLTVAQSSPSGAYGPSRAVWQ